MAAARSYATKYGYEINADQEMIALGVANAGAGFSQGLVVDGSLSRFAASDEAGAKSQMVSIIVAVMVLITVLWFTPLFYNLPEATLGAIVIHAVWPLIDFSKLRRYRRIKHIDYYSALAAMLGVLMFGILPGLILAVIISLLGLLAEAKSPHTAILGKRRERKVYGSHEDHPDAETYPGLTIFRFDEQLFFANSPYFRQEIRALVSADLVTRWVLIDAESINDIDVTALDMLGELKAELDREGVALRFAQMKELISDYLQRAGLDEVFDEECFYASVEAGVEAFLAEQAATESKEQ